MRHGRESWEMVTVQVLMKGCKKTVKVRGLYTQPKSAGSINENVSDMGNTEWEALKKRKKRPTVEWLRVGFGLKKLKEGRGKRRENERGEERSGCWKRTIPKVEKEKLRKKKTPQVGLKRKWLSPTRKGILDSRKSPEGEKQKK